MKTRTALFFLAGIGACASNEASDGDAPTPRDSIVTSDAGAEADAAAQPEPDAEACDDCDYFPMSCSPDAFCSDGPFDPATTGGSFDPRIQINVIRGRSASDVWVGGALGALAHFDGTSWSRSDIGSRDPVSGIWLRASEEVTIGALDSLLYAQHLYARGVGGDAGSPPSAGGWSAFSEFWPLFQASSLLSGWSAAGSDSYWAPISIWDNAVFGGGLMRIRRTPETMFELAGGPEKPCPPACSGFNAVHGSSADDLWAVGKKGTTMRLSSAESDSPMTAFYDSKTWNALNGVWAASESEAWSVGAGGTIRRYTGRTLEWDVVDDVPTHLDLNAVWGVSASDVWAVGDASVVLHWDGVQWTRVKVAGLGTRRPAFTAVWAASADRVWIGGQGALLSLGGKR